MVYGFYFRFFKWTKSKHLSVILAFIARFFFLIKFRLIKLKIKNHKAQMDERTAIEILNRTSPDPKSDIDYSEIDYSMKPWDGNTSLSIIVPVYNHLDVIEKCIDSLIQQKTQYEYEVLLVDDGSTDGAQNLVEKYRIHPNVRIVHQKNSGIAAARNTGISHAVGRYLMFVDCDDYVHENIVESMMSEALRQDAYIVMCAHNLVKVKNQTVVSRVPNVYPGKNMLGYPKEAEIMNYAGLPWGKVYKRELFSGVRFFPGYWYEDNIIHGLIFTQCSKFVYVPEILYEYQWHESNFSHTQNKRGQNKGIDSYWLLKAILDRYESLELEEGAAFYIMLLRHVSAYYYPIVSGLPEEVIEALFVVGRSLVCKYKPNGRIKLPFILQQTEKALLGNDIDLWKLCSVYQ